MSRYRAPQKPSSNYVTAEGRQRLRDEVYQLWKVERPVVTQAVSDAAAQGDRSENADYIYGKRRLREIDSRVRYLSKRLENFIVVDRPPEDPTRVFFCRLRKRRIREQRRGSNTSATPNCRRRRTRSFSRLYQRRLSSCTRVDRETSG